MCLKLRKLSSLDTTHLDKFNLSWKNNVVVLIIDKVLFVPVKVYKFENFSMETLKLN